MIRESLIYHPDFKRKGRCKFFTVAVIFPEQQTIQWLATMILGGAFFVGVSYCLSRRRFPK